VTASAPPETAAGDVILFRSARALMASTIATAALGVLYWVVAARLVPADELGRGAALVSTMVVLSTFAQLNLTGALVRFVPVTGRHTRRFVLGAYLASAATGVVLAVAAVLVLPHVSDRLAFIRTDTAAAVGFCAGVTLWTVFNLQDAVLTGLRRADWVPGENAAYGVAKLLLLLPLAGLGAAGVLLTWVTPLPVVLAVVTVFLLRKAIPAHERRTGSVVEPPTRNRIAHFVAVDYVGSVFSQGVPLVLPLIVVSRSGAAENARFYVAWVVASGVLTLAANVATSLTVEGAHDEAALAGLTRTVLRRVVVLGTPVLLVLVVVPALVLRVFGGDYPDAAGILRLLALAAVPRTLVVVFAAVARVRGHLWTLVLVELVAGVATLGLAAAGIGGGGAEGVAVAWLLGQLLAAVAVVPYMVRQLRVAP